MTVVYLDSVFLLNALMDYLLLLATARLAGIALRRWRYALAAVSGGMYAVAVFLPGLDFLQQAPAKIAVGVLLSLLAFGGEMILLRLTLLFFLLSCVLAGLVLSLGLLAAGGVPMAGGVFYTDINGGVLLAASTAAYLLLTVVFRASALHGMQGQILPVRLSVCGKTAEFRALQDTGNGLSDALTGRPVLVVSWSAVRGLLPWLRNPEEPMLEPLLRERPELAPRLMPYRAVGTAGGMLLSIRSDWAEIGGKRWERLRIAISPTELGDGYAALWGGAENRGG